MWWGSLERSFSDPHFVSLPTPVCSLKPKLQTFQSSWLIINGIIHGAHILSYISDIPNVPSSPNSSQRLWLLLSPAFLSVWCYLQHSLLLLPIAVKYLWIFMLRVFLAEVYQTPLPKVKTFGDGNVGKRGWCPEQGTESRFIAWASSSEEIRRLQLLQSTHLAVRSHKKFR